MSGLTWLLGCQLAGEVIVRLTGLPIPGPVVGMVLLFGWLQLRRPPDEAGVLGTADTLLRHLQLFFVPAGVGVVAYVATFRAEPVAILVALVVSWLLGLAVVGWTVTILARSRAER